MQTLAYTIGLRDFPFMANRLDLKVQWRIDMISAHEFKAEELK